MSFSRAFWLVSLVGLAAVTPIGAQESYPSRPITIVAPFPRAASPISPRGR